MVAALTPSFRCLTLGLALLAWPSVVLGHRLDEYLQATLVTIEPRDVRLQINLTPGVEVVPQVLAQIDRDNNGTISKREATAYARVLQRDLKLVVDGRAIKLKRTASRFPPLAELRAGLGIIQLEFSGKLRPLATGAHHLSLQNGHLTSLSVYLFNAAPPPTRTIEITSQKRNDRQTTGEIEFDFSPGGAVSAP